MSDKKNLLEKLWSMGEKALEKSKMSKASKRLRLQAEITVAESAEKVAEAESLFESAIKEALDTADFAKIAKASLNLQTEKKKHESNLETYKLVFLEDPKLA